MNNLLTLLAKIFPYIVILILGIFIAKGLQKDNEDNAPDDTSDTIVKYIVRTDTIYEYVPVHDTLLLPSEKEVIEIMVEKNIDTAEVVRDYFGKRIIVDTLVNDSALFLAIRDTLFMNDILSREVNYKLAERLKTINNTIYMHKPLRHKLFIGGGAIVYPDKADILLGLAFITKNDRLIITTNYGVLGNGITLGAYYKIKIKKNDYIRYGVPAIRNY